MEIYKYSLSKKIDCNDELAEKLGIAISTISETLNLIKDYGAEIAYCPHRQTYYYITWRREYVKAENPNAMKHYLKK